VDPITHAIVGAACAHVALGKKDHRIPGLVGALAAMAPDLDVFFHFFSHQPLSNLYWHRNFTHALAFIPLGGLLVTLFFMLIPFCRKKWTITLAAATIGVATHGLLDACTSYGTLLYWPWSDKRVSGDLIPIIDPLFTIVLCLGTAWSLIFHERKVVCISLILTGLYLLFTSVQHQRALEQVHQFAQQWHMLLTRIRAMPALGSTTAWRIIAEYKNCYFIANVSTPLTRKSTLTAVTQIPRFSTERLNFPLTEGQKKDLALFAWFSDNYLMIANRNPLIIADGRYTGGDALPIISIWSIELELNNNQVRKTDETEIKEYCTNE
jgi:inner membrane protein